MGMRPDDVVLTADRHLQAHHEAEDEEQVGGLEEQPGACSR
jgi:hypothetical protein